MCVYVCVCVCVAGCFQMRVAKVLLKKNGIVLIWLIYFPAESSIMSYSF